MIAVPPEYGAKAFPVNIESLFAASSLWLERETAMAILREGAVFILAAVIHDTPNLMSARTLEQSRIIRIPVDNVRTRNRPHRYSHLL